MLAESHQNRFRKTGKLLDLENTIGNQREALALTFTGNPAKAHYLCALSESYIIRFEQLEDSSDLDAAIKYGEGAVQLVGHEDLHKPRYLSNLTRSKRMRSALDIDCATENPLALFRNDQTRVSIASDEKPIPLVVYEPSGDPEGLTHAIGANAVCPYLGINQALASFDPDISPWAFPHEWNNANNSHILSVLHEAARLEGSEDFHKAHIGLHMVYPVSF